MKRRNFIQNTAAAAMGGIFIHGLAQSAVPENNPPGKLQDDAKQAERNQKNMQVEIQDEAGIPVPGYTLADCPEIIGDEVMRVVAWKNGADVTQFAGQSVRLRFAMKDADLYSFKFQLNTYKK